MNPTYGNCRKLVGQAAGGAMAMMSSGAQIVAADCPQIQPSFGLRHIMALLEKGEPDGWHHKSAQRCRAWHELEQSP